MKHQPVLINGKGKISIGKGVEIGVINSPFFFNGYAYLEARKENATIKIGNNVKINNNFSVVANESEITIEDDVLIGLHCQIFNADFHNLQPDQRKSRDYKSLPIHVEKNVFIGNNVTILKGVTIGENSVIGAGSVVVSSIPKNVIASGNPAKMIREINH